MWREKEERERETDKTFWLDLAPLPLHLCVGELF